MAYNKITLYDGIKCNYLALNKGLSSIEERNNFNSATYTPNWYNTNKQLIMANYKNTLSSSLIEGLTEPISGWNIYRQKSGDARQYLIATVPQTQLFLIDYLCSNTGEYRYTIVPITATQLGVSLQSSLIKNDFDKYILMSIKQVEDNIYIPDELWAFSYNIPVPSVVQNTTATVLPTYARLPKFSQGESNYKTITVSCLLGGIKSHGYDYYESLELLKRWNEFVAKGNLCVWKDLKGDMTLCKINANPTYSSLADGVNMPTVLSFELVEICEFNDMSVCSSTDKVYSQLENA
ncbi:MAG: hypothetical protein RR198_07000 [Oscillospiraceae bacterium]